MTQPARREVPPAFARGILEENERASRLPQVVPDDSPGERSERLAGLVSVRVLRDWLALLLVVVGMVIGVAVAYAAGGWVTGTAVLAVDFVVLGLILGASSNA